MNSVDWRQVLWDRRWALFGLRVLVGFGFAAHGYAKLERGVEHFAQVLRAMAIPAPNAMAWLTVAIELLGGIALMLGAFVPGLCVPLAVIMLTAIFGVHLPYGFSSVKLRAITDAGAQFGPVGYELSLLYLMALLVLFLSPPGPLSLDAWRARRKSM
jgi:putative oxidoreductase